MTTVMLGGILLVVAIVSLTVYLLALERLLTRPRRAGLVRTAACRVGVAVLYVIVGLTAATGYHGAAAVALVTFIAAQLVWQANSVADVALTRRSAADRLPHSRRDYLTPLDIDDEGTP
ncbi:MAG: hypothetical protein ACREQ5_38970 [Candidatus Dormibacteria bacterium]